MKHHIKRAIFDVEYEFIKLSWFVSFSKDKNNVFRCSGKRASGLLLDDMCYDWLITVTVQIKIFFPVYKMTAPTTIFSFSLQIIKKG